MLIYVFCSSCLILIGLLPLLVGSAIVLPRLYIISLALALGLSISHFVSNYQRKSSQPTYSFLLGATWLLVTYLSVFMLGFQSFGRLVRQEIPSFFLPYTSATEVQILVTFFALWFLSVLLILFSTFQGKPYGLFEMRRRWSTLFAVLLCLILIWGVYGFIRGISDYKFILSSMAK